MAIQLQPSAHIDVVNVPEVSEISANFTYNFYTTDERIAAYCPAVYRNDPGKNTLLDKLPLNKLARYVTINWKIPQTSKFEENKLTSTSKNTSQASREIENNKNKIISEDIFSTNRSYIVQTFVDSSSAIQGVAELEAAAALGQSSAKSMFGMSAAQLKNIGAKLVDIDDAFQDQLSIIANAYDKLSDAPITSLGVRFYDSSGNQIDNDDLLRSFSSSLLLNVNVLANVAPDVYRNSSIKSTKGSIDILNGAFNTAITKSNNQGLPINYIRTIDVNDPTEVQVTSLLGYIVDRHRLSSSGLIKEKTFYIEGPEIDFLVDKEVLYGESYVYSIKSVYSVKMLGYSSTSSTLTSRFYEFYVSSRELASPITCFEYTHPPEPNNVKFLYDFNKNNLVIHWDMPVNPQGDVKQFQVFRRKSIYEPFELIAQLGFDVSDVGSGKRYTTGEIVDANSDSVPQEYRYLVTNSENGVPIYAFRDTDFIVDKEFFTSSTYIYSICSVDAHGMISNYSEQKLVTFDSNKNRLDVKLICESGCPRPYPNMKLQTSIFRDTIRVSGDETTTCRIDFTPEFITVSDDSGKTHTVVEAIPYVSALSTQYVFQLLNLDNQKTQTIKIGVSNPNV